MSIHPEYAEMILDGRKRVEFRKVRFARNVHIIVMYATEPIGKVVGCFRVAGVKVASIADLWKRFGSDSGINEQTYKHYFRNRRNGIAIGVSHAERLKKPIDLSSISQSLRAPQSFFYLDAKAFGKISCVELKKEMKQINADDNNNQRRLF